MPFTFRVVFGGLCGLVPNTNGHQMRVLVVNATERLAANGESVLPTHVPLFLFDSANRRSQIGRRPLEGDRLLASAEIQEERFRTGRFCGHPLVREELCFRNEEEVLWSLLRDSPEPSQLGDDTGHRRGGRSLLGSADGHAFPGAGRIDPECLGEAPPASVAARVRLTEGVVSTASLARDPGRGKRKGKAAPAPALYVFREWVAPPGTPSRSKAAQEVPSPSEAVARVHRRASSPVGARPLATGASSRSKSRATW